MKKATAANLKSTIKKLLATRQVIAIFIILIIALFLSTITKAFLTVQNFMSIALGFSADGLLAIGMTFILISGQIDLSVGAVMGFTACVAARLFSEGLNIWLGACIAMCLGVIMGLILGFLIARLRILPYIISLGMQGVARGLVYVISGAAPIAIVGAAIQGFKSIGGGTIAISGFGKIPIFVIIFFICIVIMEILLKKTRFFSKVYFIGSNSNAAELSGIDVPKMKIFLYIISAFFASLAGVLSLARFGVATLDLGVGGESRAIMACVIGGTTMKGGEGSVLSALLGLVLVAIVSNGLILMNINAYWQNLISALMLVIVVTFDYLNVKRKAARV